MKTEKKCSVCGVVKSIGEFYKTKTGYPSQCKECEKSRKRKRYAKTKGEYDKKYYLENKIKRNEYSKKYEKAKAAERKLDKFNKMHEEINNSKYAWKIIPSTDGVYIINEVGEIFNLETGNKLKHTKQVNGYVTVSINMKTQYLHRVIASVFIPNVDGKKTVNHKDGDRTNNSIDNLEWATHSENIRHSIHELGREHNHSGRVFTSKKNSRFKTKYDYDLLAKMINDGKTNKEMAEFCGLNYNAFSQIKTLMKKNGYLKS